MDLSSQTALSHCHSSEDGKSEFINSSSFNFRKSGFLLFTTNRKQCIYFSTSITSTSTTSRKSSQYQSCQSKETFGQSPLAQGVTLAAFLCRARSWTWMILVGPFQFRIFYDSNCIHNHIQMMTKTGICRHTR